MGVEHTLGNSGSPYQLTAVGWQTRRVSRSSVIYNRVVHVIQVLNRYFWL